MISEPGIYDMPDWQYHADPCEAPSLSASIAAELLTNSPLHAWHCHPKLNPGFKREERELFDLGTAAHAYLLEGKDAFVIIDADDWRTKAAKEMRDAARAEGKLPILRCRWDEILAMVEATNHQLDAFEDRPRPFTEGKPEQTLIWQEEWRGFSISCRARLDWLRTDLRFIDDYKSTSKSANPESWSRQLFGAGTDLQAAFHLRGLQAVFGAEATLRTVMRFVVIENTPPFALSVIALAPDALSLAEKKVRLAIEMWARCLKENSWPAYPNRTCYAALPPWEEERWVARELREVA